jgi:alpha-tubulin suppressor-like RCC1 family protein
MQRERFFVSVACSWEKLVASSSSGRIPFSAGSGCDEGDVEALLDLSS